MRVLHFYKTYFPDTVGGVEQVIRQLTLSTKTLGVQNDILSISHNYVPDAISMDGCMVHKAKMNFQIASTPFSLSAFNQFAQLAKQADVIHYHYPYPFMDLVHFATRSNKPAIVTYHSDIVKQKQLVKLYSPIQKKFLNSVDKIIATSSNYLATSQLLKPYHNKTKVIPIGLDKSTYPEPANELLLKWRSQLKQPFFLFVGTLRYYKGLHILLKALCDNPFPTVIVGSGPIERELQKTAHQLGLNSIIFLGAITEEDKVALFTLCFAVVFPSHLRSEAFGVSLLEGAMYGKPMISSEIGTGTSYINMHNETGLVIPASDPYAFGQAMRYLWDNPLIAKQMGLEAEKRYWQLFTAKKMAADYVQVYNDLIF